ncbi:hypothetical protein RND71_013142 [Anisodus tanguticus]|uniref:Uncharacterized protein n=1 Tax=Anisodus tanguticus TaxID=243964 RepID=A0AAE1SGI9_9SOLA|nr:hypothetical protein RND71_013142 [Anisodus tanguticus]
MKSLFNFFFFFFLLFTSPIILPFHAIRLPPQAQFSGPSTTKKQQVFQPHQAIAPLARDFESDKRRLSKSWCSTRYG